MPLVRENLAVRHGPPDHQGVRRIAVYKTKRRGDSMKTDGQPAELELLESLVSPFGPVVAAGPTATNPRRGLSRLTYVGVSVGSGWPGQPLRGSGMKAVTAGGGKAVDDPSHARLIAIAEGAERYAAGDFLGEIRVLSTFKDLDGPAVDSATIPQCSDRELRVPGCPVRRLEPDAPIRWVMGTDLASGQPTWVPAVMATYNQRHLMPSERFWAGISTGFAVHFDPVEAVVAGILEIVERDLIAISWLQRIPLPLVSLTHFSPAAQYLLEYSNRHFIDTYLFDGTTDLDVPTVYCLQAAAYDERASHVVGAAAARSTQEAAEKALMEAVGARGVFYLDEKIKEEFSSFNSVLDGARYMARPLYDEAFDFLVDGAHERTTRRHEPLPEHPLETLRWLISTLTRHGMHVFAVDRTPAELANVGLTAVSVLIPELQPMSLRPLAQYLAHPRLYQAPELMGYSTRPEKDLNPWPMPFL